VYRRLQLRRLGLTLAVSLVWFAGATSIAAADRTVVVGGGTLWPGKQMTVGGLGWGTAYGFCPAGAITITLHQYAHDWRLAEVPATSVVPFSGWFSVNVRLPESHLSPTAAFLIVRQVERAYRSGGGCGSLTDDTTISQLIRIHHRPLNTPCTHENGCIPDPPSRIEIVERLPPGASLPPPDPVCPPTGCTRRTARARAASVPSYRPGSWVLVLGTEFPDTLDDYDCTGRTEVRFILTDSSGTAVLLPEEDANALVVYREFHTSVKLPEEGLAAGPAVLTAYQPTQASSPLCNRPASAPLHIEIPPRALQLDAAVSPHATLHVSGGWWGTDRCDRKVALVLRAPQRADQVLARVKPRSSGGFTKTVTLPADVAAGSSVVAVQSSGREIADPRGRASRARCVWTKRARKTAHRTAVVKLPAPSAAPTPAPEPTPEPTPAPSPEPPPPPTLTASIDGPDALTVKGTGWAPGDCAGSANVVTITLAHAGKPAETLGTVAPDPQGAFVDPFKSVAASSGDVVSATQSACDGTPLSQTATVP
jgi:hypothetical protein